MMMKLNIKQNIELRNINYIRILSKIIQDYIKNPDGNLDLEEYPFNKLPKNLKYVDGCLNIMYSEIKLLPRGLVVNGSLLANFSELENLTDDINIDGHVYCYDTPFSKKYSREIFEYKNIVKGNIWC